MLLDVSDGSLLIRSDSCRWCDHKERKFVIHGYNGFTTGGNGWC